MPETAIMTPRLDKDDERVVRMLKLDSEYMDLEKEYMRKVAQLQLEYTKKQEPLLQKRMEEAGEVEDFWLHVLRSHPILADEIQEWDVPILKKLRDIRTEEIEDSDGLGCSGYKVIFEFEDNEYLVENTLTKFIETEFLSEHLTEVACKSIRMESDIQWKIGKDPTVEWKKPKAGKNKKGKAAVPKKEARDSFFRSMFRTIDVQNLDEIKDLLLKAVREMGADPEECDDEEALEEMYEEAIEKVQDDAFEIANVLKNNIIPHAVKFYTGEALPDDSDAEDEDDEDEDDEDEDEDEDSEEGEDASEDEKKHASPPKDLFTKSGADQKKNAEDCKQQ
ncbi:unnamed protein product [Amoebophrya sp. A25]|nr:unnamed protein product [Amoebophrya sp. A25]|eukprot:GSA25T00003451001.1